MKKRLAWGLVIAVVVCGGAIALLPNLRFTMLGWLHGERRYEGRPTSYWVHVLKSGKDQAREHAKKSHHQDVCCGSDAHERTPF